MTAKRIRILRSNLHPCWPALICLVVVFFTSTVEANKPSREENCFAICISRCYNSSRGLQLCSRKCEDYRRETLCKSSSCWRQCKDLLTEDEISNEKDTLSPPSNLSAVYNADSNMDIRWSFDESGYVYAVQFKRQADDVWLPSDQFLAERPFLRNFSMNGADICEAIEFRVAAISPVNGFGEFSDSLVIPAPEPKVLSELRLVGLNFRPIPFKDQDHAVSSNGTLTITLEYNVTSWGLGDKDLEIVPLFHVVKCSESYDGILPNPVFYKGEDPGTIESQASADFMYYRCTVFYFINEVRSKQCEHSYKPVKSSNGGPISMRPTEINCDTVTNSGCASTNEIKHPPPECGFSSNFAYKIVDEDLIDWSDPNANISVNVTFDALQRKLHSRPPIYHVAFYGPATQYSNPQDEYLAGVNVSNFNSNVSSCHQLTTDGFCKKKPPTSFVLSNITMDMLYGVVICNVFDPLNLTFPSFKNSPQGIAPKAERVFVSSYSHQTTTPFSTYLMVGGGISIFVLFAFVACAYHLRQKRNENEKLKYELQQSHEKSEPRYTDLPKINDIWELERRNLIIYDDKKLGSGAFGAVFLGRLIGQAKGSKDAQSTLGVNLMRAENCDVAVKMLPQYADELCKSEFLREISLMKTLGYHERLVNMLACITESEPYCLVVEYCSDGDLLQYLRERCQYMLQLDAQEINYSDPNCEQEFDEQMVMTVKQLLQFAVQISYGLEYLSQKGYVHRDVAARNVLVHDHHYAKIGDFGLCRYVYAEGANYSSRGGRLPVKWMSPESIRHYEFTTKSDVWSMGVLMFEIITLGGSPYAGIQPDDMLKFLESGGRMEKPDNCPDDFYQIMDACWSADPSKRPTFSEIRQKLAHQLEAIVDEYSYLKLDAQRDYYMLSALEPTVPDSTTEKSIEREALRPSPSDTSDSQLIELTRE
ncbi:putative tyrosine-protein kinase F09A5.2 [Aphelenchoides besseyi]|nr:putative tyrosine-protein kinase F09A5.2 [Aphelenchoides besseyi]